MWPPARNVAQREERRGDEKQRREIVDARDAVTQVAPEHLIENDAGDQPRKMPAITPQAR